MEGTGIFGNTLYFCDTPAYALYLMETLSIQNINKLTRTNNNTRSILCVFMHRLYFTLKNIKRLMINPHSLRISPIFASAVTRQLEGHYEK